MPRFAASTNSNEIRHSPRVCICTLTLYARYLSVFRCSLFKICSNPTLAHLFLRRGMPPSSLPALCRLVLRHFIMPIQEQSVLILSDRVEDLAPVTSALLGLLFPLRWPHTLIPVLPASLVHYLEAPVPFLMGMNQESLDRVGADLSCVTMVNLVGDRFECCLSLFWGLRPSALVKQRSGIRRVFI